MQHPRRVNVGTATVSGSVLDENFRFLNLMEVCPGPPRAPQWDA